jgi:hypothetical protein
MTVRSAALAALFIGGAALAGAPPALAQQSFATGQNIAPAYEGWEQNEDGSFNLVFGYMNRNWEQVVDVPVGPDNAIEPGGPDRGQPTRFQPRRNRFVFSIRVPADFGDRELVWTLTANGETQRAYATLKRDYYIDDLVIQANFGAAGAAGSTPELAENAAPVLAVEGGPARTARVGEPLALAATVTDDDIPRARPLAPTNPRRPGRFTTDTATGLRLSWFVLRGTGQVEFDPPQFKTWEDTRDRADSPFAPGWNTPDPPPMGRWEVAASFTEPGTYVLRCLAHDGGLMTTEDVTFTVTP